MLGPRRSPRARPPGFAGRRTPAVAAAALAGLALVACDRRAAPAEPVAVADPEVAAVDALEPSPRTPPPAASTARAALGGGDPAGAVAALGAHASALGIDPSPAATGTRDAPTSPGRTIGTVAPDDAAGYWLLAKALEADGRPAEAAAAYREVASRLPVLTDAALLAAGEALVDAGQLAAAAELLSASRAAAHNALTALYAGIGRGGALLDAGDADGAARAYREVLDLTLPPEAARTAPAAVAPAPSSPAGARGAPPALPPGLEPIRDDGTRARILAGWIAAEEAAGRPDAARDLRRRLVRELPEAPAARTALDRLAEAGAVVDDVEAAAVLAAAGEHEAALARLEAALSAAGGPASAPGDLIVRAIRSDRALGRIAEAVGRADAFLDARADDPAAPTIALRRAEALLDLGTDDAALEAWAEIAERWPTDGVAAEALWLRARRLERRGDAPGAADAYLRLASGLPDHERAPAAAFRAGFLRWAAGDAAAAEAAWRAVAEGAAPADDRARAAFWLGRLAADAGDEEAAAAWWRQAVAASPRDGYARRAVERLRGRALEDARPVYPDVPLEGWPDAAAPEAWAALGAHPLARRLRAWRSLGEDEAARVTLGRLRTSWAAGDPARLAVLATLSADEGEPDLAIGAARAAIALRPDDVPRALARLAYPVGFDADVGAAAAERDLPVALLRALIWQESRWIPRAISHAGARGLTQVMPETGRFIAERLGEPFDPEHLLTPSVAVRFGAWYLAEQREAFGGRDAVALAAYNGGPANARLWWEAAGGDEDAFLERIAFDETRAYVRAVLGAEAAYAALYGP